MDNHSLGVHPDNPPITASDMSNIGNETFIENDEKSHCQHAKADVETASKPPIDDAPDIVLHSERDIVTHIISVDDDPSLNPWTFRAFFLGIGLSAFGGSLAEIYYFKPQTILVSSMFLAVVSYILGFAMGTFIPRRGFFRCLNPHPFNMKENAFIIIMAGAAANSALATEILAIQRLYYNITPNTATSVFLLFSSQLLGYGIGGALRSTLLYPSKMLYPGVLPLISMLDAFFRDGANARRRLRIFYLTFGVIFIWEIFPEWIFPLLTGLSIFCLAAPKSATVSRLFGGSAGNEGLGILSICLDWQYISAGWNPMVVPLKALLSTFIGYILCIVVFVAVYYNNIWESQNFPFLSQLLFYQNGSVYDQLLILNSNYEVDPTLLAEQGLPYYTGTWVVNLFSTNMALAATFAHLLLWNREDLRDSWSWMSPSNIRKQWQEFRWRNVNWKFWTDDGVREHPRADEDIDPHYALMLKYPDVPNSWYYAIFVVSFVVALLVIYKSDSTLPWWSFVASVFLATISILFVGALYAITGAMILIQVLAHTIAGYLNPGKPMASLYFVLYSYNTVSQAILLLRDLKIGQYAKLPPRASFTAQIIGTLFGAVLNYVLMNSIIDSQREVLLSVEGTNIWSGQQPQQYNSLAITWGGLSHQLFSVGKRYQWVSWSYLVGLAVPVPFWLVHRYWPKLRADYIYTPIVCAFMGTLGSGVSALASAFFTVAFVSQWWIRTRYPHWFRNYNYIVAAALDGGTQVMVFILSFAVQGAAGLAHPFPEWWGAKHEPGGQPFGRMDICCGHDRGLGNCNWFCLTCTNAKMRFQHWNVRDWQKHIPFFWTLLVASAFLRVGLILYSEWHDARSVVKYTDVDYRVFGDAARFLFHADRDNIAQGPLTKKFGLNPGNPYNRETYRYTPLLAVLLLPNEFIHASFGKYLFAACDLINGVLIYRLLVTTPPSRPTCASARDCARPPDEQGDTGDAGNVSIADAKARATFLAATHLLNPFVFSISTRGSSESILCTLILLTLYYALHHRWDAAAIMLGISTHWKIYPVIYGVSCVTALAAQTRPTSGWGFPFARSLVCTQTLRFALLSASTFFLLGTLCYAIWGHPFLYEAYLYHAHRLDHRHNFSPYFYLTYLTYPGQSSSFNDRALSLGRRLLRSPLTSLVPQLALSLGAGLLLSRRTEDLPFAWFVQTFAFVLFNRVCTSQYFLWYMLFVPLLASRVRFSWLAVVIWAGTQAVWLVEAYKLEFLGEEVFYNIWLRSLLYVGGHAWVLGNFIECYTSGI